MLLQGITTSLRHRRASAWAVQCPGHRDAWDSPKPLSTVVFPSPRVPSQPLVPPLALLPTISTLHACISPAVLLFCNTPEGKNPAPRQSPRKNPFVFQHALPGDVPVKCLLLSLHQEQASEGLAGSLRSFPSSTTPATGTTGKLAEGCEGKTSYGLVPRCPSSSYWLHLALNSPPCPGVAYCLGSSSHLPHGKTPMH